MSGRLRRPRENAGLYTPHAGSMIIQVHRERALANRTFVLGPGMVRVLRFLASRTGAVLVAMLFASWIFFAVQAARVPGLARRVEREQQTVSKLDTLERALVDLQQRYQQVQHMLGAGSPQPADPTAGHTETAAPTH